MKPDHDHPTLFVLPTIAGRDAPRQAGPRPHAPTLSQSRPPKPRVGLVEKAKERWMQFFEWSGFTKREIDCEIVPGRKVKVAIPQDAPPKVIIFRLLLNKKTGEYFTRPITLWGGLIRFNATLCEDLALPIGRTTLWRLIYAGFVDAFRTAPMTTLIDLDSLRAHMVATKIDGDKPPFWTKERVIRYREWEKITPETIAKMEAEAEGEEGLEDA